MAEKAPPHLTRFEDVSFRPRAEGADVAMLSTLTGDEQGTELGTGFGRLQAARLEWTVSCDEVLLVLEGALRVSTAGGVFDLGPRDSIRLPAGTGLVCEAEEALIFFAVHPASAVST